MPQQSLQQGPHLRAALLAHLYLTPIHSHYPIPEKAPCLPNNKAWVTDTR